MTEQEETIDNLARKLTEIMLQWEEECKKKAEIVEQNKVLRREIEALEKGTRKLKEDNQVLVKMMSNDKTNLRDMFAATTLEGMFASDTEDWNAEGSWHLRAASAYRMADLMIAERNKPPKEEF